MLIQSVELNGGDIVDVRCGQGRIEQIAPRLKPHSNELTINGHGGALIRGLHDHHIHLFALAASQSSILLGPPSVNNREQFSAALRRHTNASTWLRAYGYHESVAGHLDRWLLDNIVSDKPLRVQHRSGKMWVLNSAAIERLGLENYGEKVGLERDNNGVLSGRLFRLDDWLRTLMANDSFPDLTATSKQLARYGVTGLTDATPTNSADIVAQLTRALAGGQLLQRVLLMGDLTLPAPAHSLLQRGSVKVLLDENQLLEFDVLKQQINQAHQQQRSVAIHCVTRTELVYALTALEEAGVQPGDRIEHASIAPDEVLPQMQRLGVTVVTQHGFIHQRGDQYLQDVEHIDQPWLYRGQGFLNAGIALAGSTDAPYGSPDPWLAMQAACDRKTTAGHFIASQEALTPEQALALFNGDPLTPGKVASPLRVGDNADLCLLDKPWIDVRKQLNSASVVATLVAGQVVYRRES